MDLQFKHYFIIQQTFKCTWLFFWLISMCATVWHIKNSQWYGKVILYLHIYIFLPPSFKISVLSVADTVRTCSLDQCYKTFLSPATSETKRKMSTFVNNIKSSDSSTQHAAGFQKAFQLIRNTNNSTKPQASKSLTMQT